MWLYRVEAALHWPFFYLQAMWPEGQFWIMGCWWID